MKRILFVIAFILAIISLNACKGSHTCVAVEEQLEIDNTQTHAESVIEEAA